MKSRAKTVLFERSGCRDGREKGGPFSPLNAASLSVWRIGGMAVWWHHLLVVWRFDIVAMPHVAVCRFAAMAAWLLTGGEKALNNPTRRTFSG